MDLRFWLPTFNTALIVVSGLFAVAGVLFIRRGQIAVHRFCMLTATTFAALFLVVYVSRALLFDAKLFAGQGWVQTVYFVILGSHTLLSMIVGPLVLLTLYRALRRDFARHRWLARRTLPIWLYVVLTGWVIYLMLYQLPWTT